MMTLDDVLGILTKSDHTVDTYKSALMSLCDLGYRLYRFNDRFYYYHKESDPDEVVAVDARTFKLVNDAYQMYSNEHLAVIQSIAEAKKNKEQFNNKPELNSKYHVGDSFVIKIAEVFEGANSKQPQYRIEGFDSLTFNDRGLDRLTKLADPANTAGEFSMKVGDSLYFTFREVAYDDEWIADNITDPKLLIKYEKYPIVSDENHLGRILAIDHVKKLAFVESRSNDTCYLIDINGPTVHVGSRVASNDEDSDTSCVLELGSTIQFLNIDLVKHSEAVDNWVIDHYPEDLFLGQVAKYQRHPYLRSHKLYTGRIVLIDKEKKWMYVYCQSTDEYYVVRTYGSRVNVANMEDNK